MQQNQITMDRVSRMLGEKDLQLDVANEQIQALQQQYEALRQENESLRAKLDEAGEDKEE